MSTLYVALVNSRGEVESYTGPHTAAAARTRVADHKRAQAYRPDGGRAVVRPNEEAVERMPRHPRLR